MKKKAIKIAASTAVVASAFVAAAPANQADAATNVDQLVLDAQNAATVLKWAISIEGSGDGVTQPWAQYNNAKLANAKAEAALTGLSFSDKLKYEARLADAKLQVKRAQSYIDAITSSQKIASLTANLTAAVGTNDIEKVEAAYHVATAEYRKQSILLDRVYGQSTRDQIRNAVKPALEKLVAELKNDVTVNVLVKGAAADATALKFEDAAKKLTDAQAILDASVLKWETALQKSVNDVTAAIPLSVTSISSDFKNTVVVKFSKQLSPGASTLPAGQFTFNNGLIVQAASVAADGKTVTLTTTTQEAATAFTLSYQGKTTGLSFTTPASDIDNTIVINDTTNLFLVNGQERAYTSRFTKVDGTPYTGKVTIKLYQDGTSTVVSRDQVKITSVNGLGEGNSFTYNANTEEYVANAVNGALTFVLKDNSSVATDAVDLNDEITVTPFVSKYENNVASGKYAGDTTFSPKAAVGVYSAELVGSVSADVAKNLFYMNSEIFNFDSNDFFFIRNTSVTAEAFFKALSKGDHVTFDYKAAGNVSTFRIDSDVTLDPSPAGFKVTNANDAEPSYAFSENRGLVGKHVVTHDKDAYRLVGKGQAGYIVEARRVNANGTTDFVADTTVDANGEWVINSLNLLDGRNNFVVTQRKASATLETVDMDDVNVVIFRDFFYAENLNVTDKVGAGIGSLTIGDTINFVAPAKLNNNELKVSSNATLTVKDINGRTATIKVAAAGNKMVVTDVVNVTAGWDSTTAGLFVTSATGIVNQDNLVWKLNAVGSDVDLAGTTPQ
ncbi:hypothetical protein [Paenisporosarcina sp. NPDC076898]|uniref:hypothetical protein n=1 Tax=unclassified Paenisporosarcina TaxID=2642018 RepID=UPI003CFBE744